MKYLIVLEDDLLVSPDFFVYFKQIAPILDQDPTLFGARAWTDHGFPYFVKDLTALYRSNAFTGLGWMLARSMYSRITDGVSKYHCIFI